MKPGPRPTPHKLQVLQGKAKANAPSQGVELHPATLDQPRWADLLPGPDASTLRADCARAWELLVPELDRFGVLARVDTLVVVDACICFARVRECERLMARHGLAHATDRGMAKQPYATIAAQYRTQLKAYVAELGLSPSARSRLSMRVSEDDSIEALIGRLTPGAPPPGV